VKTFAMKKQLCTPAHWKANRLVRPGGGLAVWGATANMRGCRDQKEGTEKKKGCGHARRTGCQKTPKGNSQPKSLKRMIVINRGGVKMIRDNASQLVHRRLHGGRGKGKSLATRGICINKGCPPGEK